MASTTEDDVASPVRREVDNTVEVFCAGVEFASEWHLQQAQKWEDRGWSETAKEHRLNAEELLKLSAKISAGA